MNVYFIIISVSLLAGAAAIYMFETGNRLYGFFKPVPVVTNLCLMIHSAVGMRLTGTEFIFISGMFFGLAGDILLIKDRYLQSGMIAFLTGHLLYIMYLTSLSQEFSPYPAVPVIIFTAAYLFFFIRAFPRDRGKKLLIIAVVYSAGLSAMLYAALNADMKTGGGWYYSAGALLFFISDGTTAWEKFIRKIKHISILVLSTYYLAQALLTAGFLKSTAG